MKQLPITSPHYKYILQSFREWLDVLGYAATTVYSMPHYVQGYLYYLEQQGKQQIKDIENKSIKVYYSNDLKQRTNTLYKSGGLSNGYLNKYLQALQKFSDYLRQSGRLNIPKLYIKSEEDDPAIRDILTQEEIKLLSRPEKSLHFF
jgi:integrase/recombinase XerD